LEENPKVQRKKIQSWSKKLEILTNSNNGCQRGRKNECVFPDECHPVGDVCGYIWGKTNIRIEVPIVNERQKQTYYGALDY